MILVLGGGIAGLAAANALRAAGREFLVLEREREPGGWCRSLRDGRYRFDMSGHFLHLPDPSHRERFRSLEGVDWVEVARDARVFLRGRLTPFPFQANLHGHDPAFVRRCLSGYRKERERDGERGETPPGNLEDWLLRRFGEGMCRSFFFPYNRKLWRTPLSRLGYDWTDWSVPVPRIEEVEAGARGEGKGRYGYNTTFLYPAEGGIGSLVSALAAPVASRIRTGDGVVELDLRRRTARTAGGETIRWEAAVSTIPLPALANASLPLSAGCREAADALAWVKVLAVNLGIANPGPFPGHWHYVPERGYPFFRVGSLSNVWPGAAPPGSGSFFAERSFPSSARVDVGKETDAILAGLRKSGLLAPGSRLESVRPVMLDPAYVLFDRRRSPARKRLLSSFERKGVFPAGRYGAWDYNGMAASVADGVRAAGRALGYGG